METEEDNSRFLGKVKPKISFIKLILASYYFQNPQYI